MGKKNTFFFKEEHTHICYAKTIVSLLFTGCWYRTLGLPVGQIELGLRAGHSSRIAESL